MHRSINSIFVFLLFAAAAFAQAKPQLAEADLQKHTYYFDVADNKMSGPGADFLQNEIKQNQYILLGEYHNSYQISKFTRAMIPMLDGAGFKTFGLEVGPVSVEFLRKMSSDPAKTVGNLSAFNSKFYVPTKNRNYTPIPFFSNVEDAEFLAEAAQRKWNLIGLDQEFVFGYLPLLEQMQNNLKPKRRSELAEAYNKAVRTIETGYENDDKGGKRIFETITDSAEVNKYLDMASENNPANQRIAAAIRKTTDIYLKSVKRQYFAQNSDRIEYMKKNLAESFAKAKFDLKRDKMLLKIGGVHSSRGFGPLSLFEIGNTLSELAAYNGNRSLHINFNSRFYMDNGKDVDELADPKGFGYRFKTLLQMSKRDKWTIIDLRPLRSEVFYARKYDLDEVILDIFKSHDIYIMPPLDIDPTQNFKIKN